MEHRYNPRVPASLKAVLYLHHLPTAIYRTINLSHGGVAVQAPAECLGRNAYVEIELIPDGTGRKDAYRFPAFVIHRRDGLLGLAFGDLNAQQALALRILLRLVRSAEPAPATGMGDSRRRARLRLAGRAPHASRLPLGGWAPPRRPV